MDIVLPRGQLGSYDGIQLAKTARCGGLIGTQIPRDPGSSMRTGSISAPGRSNPSPSTVHDIAELFSSRLPSQHFVRDTSCA